MANLNQEIYVRVMRCLDIISQGKTITKACDEAHITKSTLEHFIAQDDFIALLANEAEQRGYDVMADILLHIDDVSNEYGSTDPKIMKIKSDNIKWFLSRKNGLKYGDRLTVENIITADKTVVEMLSRGKQRALDATARPLIQGVVEDVVAVIVDPNDDAQQFY